MRERAVSGGRTTIPEWEIRQLRAVTDAPTVGEREQALAAYLAERERRRRYARTRDARDRQRRTLVGAHMPWEEAERVAHLADLEGMSVTAYVKRALRQAGEGTMAAALKEAQDGDGTPGDGWAAVSVPRW